MKGNFEGSYSKFASVMSDFVEEQKNKDLLDVSSTPFFCTVWIESWGNILTEV